MAVPAQRAAGVSKPFGEDEPMDLEKCLEAAGSQGLRLTKSQARELFGCGEGMEGNRPLEFSTGAHGDVLRYSAILSRSCPGL